MNSLAPFGASWHTRPAHVSWAMVYLLSLVSATEASDVPVFTTEATTTETDMQATPQFCLSGECHHVEFVSPSEGEAFSQDGRLSLSARVTAEGQRKCSSGLTLWLNDVKMADLTMPPTVANNSEALHIDHSIELSELQTNRVHTLSLSCAQDAEVASRRFRLDPPQAAASVIITSPANGSSLDVFARITSMGYARESVDNTNALPIVIRAKNFDFDLGGGLVTCNDIEVGVLTQTTATVHVPTYLLRPGVAYKVGASLIDVDGSTVAHDSIVFFSIHSAATAPPGLRFIVPLAEERFELAAKDAVAVAIQAVIDRPYPAGAQLQLYVDGLLHKAYNCSVLGYDVVMFEAFVPRSLLKPSRHVLHAVLGVRAMPPLVRASVGFAVAAETSVAVRHVAQDLREFITRHADEQRNIVVVMTNHAFVDFTLNVLCGGRKAGLSQLVVVATDRAAFDDLQQRRVPVILGTQLGPYDYVSDIAGFGSQAFNRLTHVKTKVVYQILSLGFNVLFLDADIVILHNPFPYFAQHADADIQLQMGNPHNYTWATLTHKNFNTGMYYTKSSRRTIQLMEQVLAIQFSSVGHTDNDQIWINEALIRRPDVITHELDPLFFPNGDWFFTGLMPQRYGRCPVMVHSNYVVGHKTKLERNKRFGLWELDDSLECIARTDTDTNNRCAAVR